MNREYLQKIVACYRISIDKNISAVVYRNYENINTLVVCITIYPDYWRSNVYAAWTGYAASAAATRSIASPPGEPGRSGDAHGRNVGFRLA